MMKFASVPLAALCLATCPYAATAATVDVSVRDNNFNPRNVTIDVGDTVRWTNAAGGNQHDVTADNGSFSNPEGTVSSFTYSRTFNSVADIRYFCTRHGGTGGSGMSGQIFVVDGSLVPPVANFSSSCTGLDCNFTDQSTDSDGNIASWSWDFGDGAQSSAQNPAHSYASAGTFQVDLTASDNDGASDSQSHNVTVTDPSAISFLINAAISDAWFYPVTSGQGFFIIVWEDSKTVFLAWFTYDTERPPDDVMALLGEPGHRWIIGLGPYDGDTALLDVFLSSGMIFDSGVLPVDTVQYPGATMEIIWSGCNEGLVKYDIPSLMLMGEVPIQRIVEDNVPACLAAQPQ